MVAIENELGRCSRTVPPHLRSKMDLDDLLQEVRARILRAGASFEGRADPEIRRYVGKTMAAVTREAVRDYDRDRRCVGRERVLPQSLASDHTSPTQRAIRNELLDRLASALAALPDDQRLAIELKHLRGLSMAETAARMNKTRQAVAGLLRRGIQDLRERLGSAV